MTALVLELFLKWKLFDLICRTVQQLKEATIEGEAHWNRSLENDLRIKKLTFTFSITLQTTGEAAVSCRACTHALWIKFEGAGILFQNNCCEVKNSPTRGAIDRDF